MSTTGPLYVHYMSTVRVPYMSTNVTTRVILIKCHDQLPLSKPVTMSLMGSWTMTSSLQQ